MNQQAAAIIFAGGLIAAATALSNHRALHTAGDTPVLRLNRWTGSIVVCGGMLQAGGEMPARSCFRLRVQPQRNGRSHAPHEALRPVAQLRPDHGAQAWQISHDKNKRRGCS